MCGAILGFYHMWPAGVQPVVQNIKDAKDVLANRAYEIAARCKQGHIIYASCRFGVPGAIIDRHKRADIVQGKDGIELLFWPQLHEHESDVLRAIDRFTPGDPDTDHRTVWPADPR